MEEVCERDNLRQAMKRVKANRGARESIAWRWENFRSTSSSTGQPFGTTARWTDKSQPVLRGNSEADAVRKLGIPTCWIGGFSRR